VRTVFIWETGAMEKDIYIYFLKKELTHPSQQQFKKKKGWAEECSFLQFQLWCTRKRRGWGKRCRPWVHTAPGSTAEMGRERGRVGSRLPPALDVHMYWFRLQPGNSTAVVYLLPNIEDNSSASPVLSISFKCLCPSVIVFQLCYLSHHVFMIARA